MADTSTVAGVPVPESPGLARMHADRVAKLRREMQAAGVDALLLLGTNNVSYATGALAPGTDSSRSRSGVPHA